MVRIGLRELSLQLGSVGGAAIRQRREIDFRDPHVLEHHRAQHLVDLGTRTGEDHTKGFCLRAGSLDRERRAECQLIVGPLADLRLVDEHLRIREVDHARPGVGRGSARGIALGVREAGCELNADDHGQPCK